MELVNKITQPIKKVFSYIGQAFALVFITLYEILSIILDDTIGLIFTKTLRKPFKKYEEEHPLWKKIKTIILLVIFLFIVFSFPTIYDYSIGVIFNGIFKFLGNILNGNMYGDILTEYGSKFTEGIRTTLYLSLIGTVMGLLIALLFSALVTIKINPTDSTIKRFFKHLVRKIIKLYVTIIRGTPMMVQAMILFWGVRGVLNWDYLIAGLVTVTINTTAYLTEVLRGGIESIDKGQTEGAMSLGLNSVQTMLFVIYPQAIKNSMAAIGNEFVINIKDTAVLSVIMVEDIFRVAEIVQGKYIEFFPPFIIAALIYLFLTSTVSAILRRVEKRLNLPSLALPSSN